VRLKTVGLIAPLPSASSRAHAGENLATLLPQRLAPHDSLIVMSDAVAEIHRLDGEQDADLRGQLEHPRDSKNVRTRVAKGTAASWVAIRSRAPSGPLEFAGRFL
jgi:hypothetical protein